MEGSRGDTACWKETGIWNETQAPDLPVPLEGREAVADGGDWRWESCFNVLPVLPGQMHGHRICTGQICVWDEQLAHQYDLWSRKHGKAQMGKCQWNILYTQSTPSQAEVKPRSFLHHLVVLNEYHAWSWLDSFMLPSHYQTYISYFMSLHHSFLYLNWNSVIWHHWFRKWLGTNWVTSHYLNPTNSLIYLNTSPFISELI